MLSKCDRGMATPELMEVHNDDDVVDIINCVALYYKKLRRQWECISSGRKILELLKQSSESTLVYCYLDCLQSAFSLKIRLVLISASAIANHDVMLQ